MAADNARIRVLVCWSTYNLVGKVLTRHQSVTNHHRGLVWWHQQLLHGTVYRIASCRIYVRACNNSCCSSVRAQLWTESQFSRLLQKRWNRWQREIYVLCIAVITMFLAVWLSITRKLSIINLAMSNIIWYLYILVTDCDLISNEIFDHKIHKAAKKCISDFKHFSHHENLEI